MKNFIKNNILSRDFILPLKKGYRFIFIYHDISDPNSGHYSPSYSTTKIRFKEQISFLSDHFEFVDLDAITQEEPFKQNVASIIFDDGFKSIETEGVPFLKKMGIPFAVFLNRCAIENNRLWVNDLILNKAQFLKDYKLKDILNNDSVDYKVFENDVSFNNGLSNMNLLENTRHQIYLNKSDVLKLKENGAIIGNHGSFHANLTMCDTEMLEKEVVENKKYLESLINSKITHYAYAFGKKEHYSLRAMEIIKNSGHMFSYTSNPSAFKEKFNQYTIPRIGLTNESPAQIMFYINRQFMKSVNL